MTVAVTVWVGVGEGVGLLKRGWAGICRAEWGLEVW